MLPGKGNHITMCITSWVETIRQTFYLRNYKLSAYSLPLGDRQVKDSRFLKEHHRRLTTQRWCWESKKRRSEKRRKSSKIDENQHSTHPCCFKDMKMRWRWRWDEDELFVPPQTKRLHKRTVKWRIIITIPHEVRSRGTFGNARTMKMTEIEKFQVKRWYLKQHFGHFIYAFSLSKNQESMLGQNKLL